MFDNSKRRTYYIDSLLDKEINCFQNNYDYQTPLNKIMTSKYEYNRTDFNSEISLHKDNNDNKVRYTYSINKSTTNIPKILYEFRNISPSELDKKTMELLRLEKEINNLRITDTKNKSKSKKRMKRSNTKPTIYKNTFNYNIRSNKSLFSKSKSLKNSIPLKKKSTLDLRQLNLANINKEKYMKVKKELDDVKKLVRDIKKRNLINSKKIKNKDKLENSLKNKNNSNLILNYKNEDLEQLLQSSNSIVKKQKDLIKRMKMKINELKHKNKY